MEGILRGGRVPIDFEIRDMREGRAASKGMAEVLQILLFASGQHLHLAGSEVANPTL